MKIKSAALGAIAALALSASAANAQLAPVASYTSLPSFKNMYWKNTQTNNLGNGGSLFSISTSTSTTPGASLVLFNFDPTTGIAVTGIRAELALFGTSTSSPATLSGGVLTQGNLIGSFSFTAKAASGVSQTIGIYTIPDGTNLLSASYSLATISGVAGGSTALFESDVVNGTLSFTTDPMFTGSWLTPALGFKINITGITPALSALTGSALSSFDPGSTGTFYAGSVPEPASWALMVAGFGLAGGAMRRQRRTMADGTSALAADTAA